MEWVAFVIGFGRATGKDGTTGRQRLRALTDPDEASRTGKAMLCFRFKLVWDWMVLFGWGLEILLVLMSFWRSNTHATPINF